MQLKVKFNLRKAKLYQIWLALYIPFIPLITYDLITTYWGVCIQRGFEMSDFALWIVPKIGYIPASLLLFGLYALGMLILAYFLYAFRQHDIWRVFLLFFWCLAMISYLRGFLINTNTLVYLHTNQTLIKPSKLVHIPASEIKEKIRVFHQVKKDFCRLI